MREPVLECSFYVPVARDARLSSGGDHADEAWQWLDDELSALFGGQTIAYGLNEGFYKDPDTQQRVDDRSRKYIVAVPTASLDRLRALLAKSCVVFHQKCIYLSIAGHVEFIAAHDA